ncbi:hypothetical protein KNJ79_07130 [Sphingopyxis indica]|uniref:hypothetical protein n=1 Tax=Sphingopyxis indica TaxID=436663 RepID=UPI002939291B|nr:hypothetical protein [Sphingopyxis indica]WOF44675.1 hypothetical protein KNJ79_07130 [Sphingopyxis indica]
MDKAETDLSSLIAADEKTAWQELKRLLGQRITESLAGALSTNDITSIIDEELEPRHSDT